MTEAISLTFPGVPVAKGRPRALARIIKVGGIAKAMAQLVTPPETRAAEARLAKLATAYMNGRAPLAGPVRMQVVAIYEPPASWTKTQRAALAAGGIIYHTGKPDADNLAKLVGDALNEIAYQDDSQVAELVVRKRYGLTAQTTITISPLQSAAATSADKRRAAIAPTADTAPRLL